MEKSKFPFPDGMKTDLIYSNGKNEIIAVVDNGEFVTVIHWDGFSDGYNYEENFRKY